MKEKRIFKVKAKATKIQITRKQENTVKREHERAKKLKLKQDKEEVSDDKIKAGLEDLNSKD